ncbi:BREX system Lon protease-like protein BrxL, partial [Arthrospira platensis SPKY1]|nr:BREX system Lon protease-like protein BrxL [Arthrospira platensis SPKY1]
NETKGIYEASFANLNIRRVPLDTGTIKAHPKLLSNGVWSIITLSFMVSEEKGHSPWIIENLKPIQISKVDIEEFKSLRKEFTKEEWMALLMQSIGLVPEHF